MISQILMDKSICVLNWTPNHPLINLYGCRPYKRTLMRTGPVAAVLCLFLSLTSVTALSYSVCDNLAAEYTTATPQLTGTWPYYNLLYT